MTDKIAVIICVQGNRDAAAVEKFNSLAARLKHFFPDYDEESDFLGLPRPTIVRPRSRASGSSRSATTDRRSGIKDAPYV